MMGVSGRNLVTNLRGTSIVLGLSNMAVIALGTTLLVLGQRNCKRRELVPVFLVSVGSVVKIVTMVRCAIEQEATARSIVSSSPDLLMVNADVTRIQRKMRYIKWIWWTRFATIVTIVQFLLAMYLTWTVAKSTSQYGTIDHCIIGSSNERWKKNLLASFLIMMCFVAVLQCFTSPDVLRWRSFYATHDNVWKAHYQEVFDHGIREALCCLGRAKYLTAMEEDEVNSVAQLLGDLVTYRASGTGHLEILAGLALLQKHSQSPDLYEGSVDAPEDKIQEAIALHPFAEAAYTGPLLDVGRNLVLFPCAWLHRQGIFTIWSRNRWPVLQGDNWWRGHAAAFLNYVNLAPEALRCGRVNQAKCKAAYFVVVLHHLKTIVVAVRGTETPEDLITDGLCGESSLTIEDLDGLINGHHIDPGVRQNVIASFPHYGHSGIVEAARELFKQIDGSSGDQNEDMTSGSGGFLSSLLGAGRECDGYALRVVGHSLGGAIAAVLGLRLRSRYPNLHVYSYGPLPCVDSVVADACSDFITSIVHDSEFSSYLSINSVLRLRAAALAAVSQDTTNDATLANRLARLFLDVSKYQKSRSGSPLSTSGVNNKALTDDMYNRSHGNRYISPAGNLSLGQESYLLEDAHPRDSNIGSPSNDSADCLTNLFAVDESSMDDPVSEFMEVVPSSSSTSAADPPEVFLPGLVIHLVKQHARINMPPWRGCGIQEHAPRYKAVLANRENFKDIVVSPYMFLDHLPWRCHYALQKVLESQHAVLNGDERQMV